MTFHPGAWVLWLCAAATVPLAMQDPFTTCAALIAIVAVAAGLRARAPEGRSYALFLRLGLLFIAARVVLFGLTGHTGPTTLFTLPELRLPGWLGGFSIGGRVTGEVVAQAAAEGLALAAALVAFGAFLSVVRTYRVLRLLPRFLFEAGLVVSIALAFVPTLLRSAATIRDAQRLRGHRFRGVRALRPLVVPILADALERSLTLADSMQTRGYGRHVDRDESAAHAAAALGLIALAAGSGLMLFDRIALGATLAIAGGCALAWGLRAVAAAAPRTRYRPERWTSWDVALAAASVVTIGATLVARTAGAGAWYPYPILRWPVVEPVALVLALSLATPLVLHVARAGRLERASAAQPILEPVP